MTEPYQVQLTRGDSVESEQLVDVVISDWQGKLVFVRGDRDRLVFARSAVKMIQAIPLARSCAVAKFGLTDAHLALSCASHEAEPQHLEVIDDWLYRLGLDKDAFVCGAQWPVHPADIQHLHPEAPDRRHNNCSGKHLGFLSTAVAQGLPIADYHLYGHPVQQEVIAALSRFCALDCDDYPAGVDGCQILTYALPLSHIALGIARFCAAAQWSDAQDAAACQRLLLAQLRHPQLLGGSASSSTRLTEAGAGQVVVKNGAEGVLTAAHPDRQIGIAVKCRGGHNLAAEAVMAHVLHAHEILSEPIAYPITTWAGDPVGRVQVL